MTTWGALESPHPRAHSISNGEDVIPQKIQRQAESTSNWSIPATHGSPSIPLKMKQSPNVDSQRIPHSKLMSVFEELDRQCRERSSKIESDAKEALRTQLSSWVRSREKLYLAQLREVSEQFRKTTLAAIKERQAAELTRAIADEKAKFADEYHLKLKEVQEEREQLVQRRLELLRQMEEAIAMAGQLSKDENKSNLNVQNSQHREVTMQINVSENKDVLENEIRVAKKEARQAKEELVAAVQARDEAFESLENVRSLQEKAVLESINLQEQYKRYRTVFEQEREAKDQKLKQLKSAAEGARVEISSLKAELQAVQLKLYEQGKGGHNLSEMEANMLIERAEAAEAAAAAAEEAKEELERCTADAEVARTAAESQASHLRHRLEELIKENNALQRGMLAAEEAVRAASTSEKATAADQAALAQKLDATKEALATHRAAISQLESHLNTERTNREALQTIAQNAATLQTEAAAWEERTLRHAEDTRLCLAAALRDIEAVCLAARALGQSSSSSSNAKYTGPLLCVIKESEENAKEATTWLKEAQIEGKALAISAPCSSSLIIPKVDVGSSSSLL
jgi:hypothetical protein